MFIRIKSARGNLKVTQLLFVPLDLFFQEASKVKHFGLAENRKSTSVHFILKDLKRPSGRGRKVNIATNHTSVRLCFFAVMFYKFSSFPHNGLTHRRERS